MDEVYAWNEPAVYTYIFSGDYYYDNKVGDYSFI
jgi:hypothetical protein